MKISPFKAPLLLSLTLAFSACRQSPEPTVKGPWKGTLTKDGQVIATLSGNLDYVSGDMGLIQGNLSGLDEPLTVSAPTGNGPAYTGNLTATGLTIALNCTSKYSIDADSYKGDCMLTKTKNGQGMDGYKLYLKRIY